MAEDGRSPSWMARVMNPDGLVGSARSSSIVADRVPARRGAVPVWCPVMAKAYPDVGHPHGPGGLPWFELRGDLLYPDVGNPEGRSEQPWYRVRGGFVYPEPAHPVSGEPYPWFSLRGGKLYPE